MLAELRVAVISVELCPLRFGRFTTNRESGHGFVPYRYRLHSLRNVYGRCGLHDLHRFGRLAGALGIIAWPAPVVLRGAGTTIFHKGYHSGTTETALWYHVDTFLGCLHITMISQ